ncbi:MAG: monofunctional biosynthetic peptidoglycan transglycosylase [Sphingobacteriia bacterium]|nr:monofunctional biosynthetic peptidoglycan transglycosylase [Sphingobacteriia bacterium]NCC41048.1 monofunctional biosynthetic peptidoglycan transglycosylase [Gammaproteobacteria bacterium]
MTKEARTLVSHGLTRRCETPALDPATTPARRVTPRVRGPLRRLARLLLTSLAGLVWISVALVITLRWLDPPASSFMLRHAYNLWRLERAPPYYRHQWVPHERIAPAARLAAIAGEDQRFPNHHGFDLIEIRLAWRDHRNGAELRGASTITQQTAKNLFLWPERGWPRKLLEAWLTVLMELAWPKERILEVYLNIAQFGPGTYGIGAASERYFGHPASDLSLGEAALLIALLPAPGAHRPDQPSERLRRRAAWISDQAGRLGGVRYLDRL